VGTRSVTSWLDQITYFQTIPGPYSGSNQAPQNEGKSQRALKALVAGGPKVIPTLTKIMAETPVHSIRSQNVILDWAERHGLITREDTFDLKAAKQRARQYGAGLVFVAIGRTNGGGIVRFLEVAAESQDLIISPEVVLMKSKSLDPKKTEEVRTALLEAMQSTNARVRLLAVGSTRMFPETFEAWESQIIKLTHDEDQHVREFAIIALASFKNSKAREILERILVDTAMSALERYRAAEGLGYMGSAGVISLPLLRSMTNHTSEQIRRGTRAAVARIEDFAKTNQSKLPQAPGL